MSDLPPRNWRPPASASDNGDWTVQWYGEEGYEEPRFVESPLLQAGTFHLLAGMQGVGKGLLSARWVARCTTGDMYGEPRPALWLASEEQAKKDINPRIKVAGGDPFRVARIPSDFRLPNDIDKLRRFATTAIDNVGLIVIDPLSNHTGRADTNVEEEVRQALTPLAELAEEIDIPIIGIRHLSSKESKTGVLARILGSTAWVAVPRVVLAVVADNEGSVHVRPVKGNRMPTAEAGRKFRLEGMPFLDWEMTVGMLIEEGESTVDLDALLAQRDTNSSRARQAIIQVLRDAGGQMESDVLDATVAERAGVSARTSRNLRGELRDKGWVRAFPEHDGTQINRWMVSLTNAAPYDRDLVPSRARGGAGEESVESLAEISPPDLTLLDQETPEPPHTHPQASEGHLPTAPTDPTPTSPTCPVCGSTNVGPISGRCHDCGSKVNPQDKEVYGDDEHQQPF